jgi:hypothetical protein
MGNSMNRCSVRQTPLNSGLYGHLLTCVDLALAEADTTSQLRRDTPGELELHDLTQAEVQLIRAYLEQDLHWLCGWHAAAHAQAALERQTTKVAWLSGASDQPAAQPTAKFTRR